MPAVNARVFKKVKKNLVSLFNRLTQIGYSSVFVIDVYYYYRLEAAPRFSVRVGWAHPKISRPLQNVGVHQFQLTGSQSDWVPSHDWYQFDWEPSHDWIPSLDWVLTRSRFVSLRFSDMSSD